MDRNILNTFMTIMTIEAKIPLRRRVFDRFPEFEKLRVGQSFVVPDDVANHFVLNNARRSAEAQLMGRRFATRKVDGGRRVWRIQ